MRNEVVVAGILVTILGFALFLVSTTSSTQEELVLREIPSFQKTVTVPHRESVFFEEFVFDAALEGWTPHSVVFEHSDFLTDRANITDPDGSEIPNAIVSPSHFESPKEFSFRTRREGTYTFLVNGSYFSFLRDGRSDLNFDDTIDVSIYKLVERVETYYPYEILRYGAIGCWIVGFIISIVGLTTTKCRKEESLFSSHSTILY